MRIYVLSDGLGDQEGEAFVPGKMTLDKAMIEVLQGRGWVSLDAVAAEIAKRDLYVRKDGTQAEGTQIRRRAVQSNGRHLETFEVAHGKIRLRQ